MEFTTGWGIGVGLFVLCLVGISWVAIADYRTPGHAPLGRVLSAVGGAVVFSAFVIVVGGLILATTWRETPPSTGGSNSRSACEQLWEENRNSAQVSRSAYLRTCLDEGMYDEDLQRENIKAAVCDDPSMRAIITDWDEQCR